MPAVKLLSTPGIFVGAEQVHVPKGKTSALLYYLAYQGDWVNREDILYLFWSDTEELKARNNLRQLLGAIRKLPFVENLETAKDKLHWLVPNAKVPGNTHPVAFSVEPDQVQTWLAVHSINPITQP